MRVLIIPEDFRKDEQILKPIIAAVMGAVGKPKARVTVCKDPLLGGIGEALKWGRIDEIIERYKGMVDLFLLLVDRDQVPGRRQQLDTLEAQAATKTRLIAENAWQEVEVWVLAGHDLPADWVWTEIRAERDPKEQYFEPLARLKGVIDEPAQGRGTLAIQAAKRYDRVRILCDEVRILEERIRANVG